MGFARIPLAENDSAGILGNMRSSCTALLFLMTVLASASAQEQREYIILSGGPSLIEWEKFKDAPHDRWWGNFIRSARVRIEQLRKQHGPTARITWLVYKPGYVRRAQRQDHSDLIGNIASVRDKYGLNLVFFSDTGQLINYLNYGQPRNRVKIANFEFYGHSNKACFMFDYSNEIDSASKVWLHETELKKIHRGIFARNAFVKSWGCHTAESMSKYWRRAVGNRMIGAFGKTDYAKCPTNGWIPQLTFGARWGG
ncbi:MAG: hypothetical protein WBV90_17175 [Terrimicrobiaceae bacterium]